MITGVFQSITKKPSSHTHGWSRTWAENLKTSINHDNEALAGIYVDHGVNFGGSLNLFGGYDDKLDRRVRNALEAEVVWSLDIDMPDYARMLGSRKDVPREILQPLEEWQAKAKTLRSTDLGLPWLTIGDSHTAAWAPWDSMVVKENGKTLFGQANSGFSYVREFLEKCPQIRGVTMVFGNIDVRHHIIRTGSDWREMYAAWREFGDSLDIEVEYAAPWPVEFEGRKLPKSGWYKGEPFWGSWQERSELVRDIHAFMEREKMKKVSFPDEWFALDPETYAKDRMEKPQSVHLSPLFYRRTGWGQ
jgi:hypothetical protein